jgi:predicted permease
MFSWLHTSLLRLRALFASRKLDDEFDQEIRDHIALLEEENIRRGMSPEEARCAALRSFGGVAQVKESNREKRGWHHLELLFQDLRYAGRMMRKNSGFTAVAVLTLALGIGANTAMFSVVNAVILRSLPYENPDRIAFFLVGDAAHGGFDDDISVADFTDWNARNRVFDEMAAFQGANMVMASGGMEPRHIDANLITANFLPMLGWRLSIGRNFLPEEEQPGQNNVAILSDDCWHRNFSGNPNILGQKIRLNSQMFTVVGVLQPGLRFWGRDVYVPFTLANYAANRKLIGRTHALAHLKPNVTLTQAQTEMQAIAQQLQIEYPATNQYRSIHLQSFKEEESQLNPTPRRMHQSLLVLLGAVGFVTLMACANVASLLLARGLKRQKEFVMRVALGASRARIVAQLLTESILLFICGGAAGYGLAVWSRDLMVKVTASYLEGKPVELNTRVFLFSFGISLLTGLLFGLVPAIQAIRVKPNDALKTSAIVSGGGWRRNRARSSLIVFEISLAMVMLVAFGLLTRSFIKVMDVYPGFDRTNLLTTAAVLDQQKYSTPQQQAAFSRTLLDQIHELAGVQSAGVASSIPLMGGGTIAFLIEGRDPLSPAQSPVRKLEVSPEYFSALRIRLLQGRPFTDHDNETAPAVAIVNETLARRYFPGETPLGKRVRVGDGDKPWREIVGVIADVRQRNMDEDIAPIVYSPWYQAADNSLSIIVRTNAEADLRGLSAKLRSKLRSLDMDQAWEPIQTMQQVIDDSESVSLRRPIVLLLGAFGSVALVLALIGIYGVLSYTVAEQTREIGIRVALGALPRNVMHVVLRQTLVLLAGGLSLGLVSALALTRLLPTGPIGWSGAAIHLYGISRTDALTYCGVTLILTLVALMASYIPAQRATRIDPMVALRYE